ncbi:hypothetical protein KY337_01175 [Candidatus Woesearchaeota archaeon]|nr:hypothetical protein [Candidatus Woesearchaeota archaeon]
MATVNEAYEKIDDLEEKLRSDLRKAFFLSQNFQAYADYAVGYLRAIGKEVDYTLVEKAVRESSMMRKVWQQLDKVKYSYNDLVREVATIRRDSIAKSLVTTNGADDIHSLKDVLIKYGVDPEEDKMFSKATYIIAETRKSDIEKRFGQELLRRAEWIIPNNMTINDFAIFLKSGYANSALKEVESNG